MDDKKFENLYELIKYAGYPTGLIINFNNKQIPVEEYDDEELSESLVDLTNWAVETDYISSYATNLPQF